MENLKLITLASLVALTTACSNGGGSYAPLVDGAKNPNFSADLTGCQNLAKSQPLMDGQTGNAAVVGAALGGMIGAVDDDGSVGEGLVAGAIGGALSDVVTTSDDRKSIVIECMQSRGHAVVG